MNWISIKDALPNPYKDDHKAHVEVLVFDGKKVRYVTYRHICKYITDEKNKLSLEKSHTFYAACKSCGYSEKTENVTHWMELPKEPRKNDGSL